MGEKETAVMREHERRVEFELCLKRMVCLAQDREDILQTIKKYEQDNPSADYSAVDEILKKAIKSEAKYLASL